jgi:hypothetical protein
MNKIAQAKVIALTQASTARKRASLAALDVESASIVEDLQNLSEIGRNHPDPVFRKAAAKNWQKILAALGILGGTGTAAALGAKAFNRPPKDFDNFLYSEEEAFAPAPKVDREKNYNWDIDKGQYIPDGYEFDYLTGKYVPAQEQPLPEPPSATNAYAKFFKEQGLSKEEIADFERKMNAVSDADLDEYERARQVAGGPIDADPAFTNEALEDDDEALSDETEAYQDVLEKLRED